MTPLEKFLGVSVGIDTLYQLFIVFLLGVLLFDLILVIFNGRLTLSRAESRQVPWKRMSVCLVLVILLFHFYSIWGG